jgi:hypothetical protein
MITVPFDQHYRVSSAEGVAHNLTMVWLLLAMALRTARTTGSSATRGVQTGERLGTSAWSATSTRPLGSAGLP